MHLALYIKLLLVVLFDQISFLDQEKEMRMHNGIASAVFFLQ